MAQRAIAGVATAILVWSLLSLMVTAWRSRRDNRSLWGAWQLIWNGGSAVPWREMLITAGLLLLVLAPMLLLSAKYHVLGTDKVGQDVFYQALKSIRTGLVIGTLTTLVMLPFALLLGIMAGYFRGWVDDVIQYVYTTLNSIPGVLLIAAAVLMLQVHMDKHPELFETVQQRADARLLVLCLILGVTSWTGLCRLLRGESLKLREMEYIQAAQAFGVSSFRIITRHILPNVMHIVLIAVVHGFQRPGAGRGGAVLRWRRRGSDHDQLRHHDQLRAPGNGARTDGVVVAGCGIRLHVDAGAVRQPVRRRGARCLRSAHPGEAGDPGLHLQVSSRREE